MEKLEQYLKGNGLFVFSDPGGAKPILALVRSLAKQEKRYKIISDRDYSFYKEFGLEVQKPSASIGQDVQDPVPDFIFTGTSYTSKIELAYIKEGAARGIPTYAFVDHWTNIRERFDNKGTEVLPKKICVIDQRAKVIALKQGIEEDRILVTGNPFQDYLRSWHPVTNKKEFFEKQGIDIKNKKIIVFAPDPLSNVDGKIKFGFDEVQVVTEMNELIDDILEKYIFIFKPHPNQDMARLNKEFLDKIIVADQAIENNSLIYHSDFIVGFFSSYLIEADIMKKKVLRYLPEHFINDPFKDSAIGTIVNSKNFLENLNHQL